MPTTYETKTTTTTSSPSPTIGFHPEYLRTLPGILKVVEIVLALITFICACVVYWGSGQGWVEFVSMSAFLCTLIYLILHLINLISRFPGPQLLIEFIYYCVFSVLFLIAAIVAAAKASAHSSIGATAFFAFAATAVYAVDTFFQFRAWRSGQDGMATNTTTTTTTTSTTVEHGQVTY